DHAEIVLYSAALQTGENSAAKRNGFAAFIKAGVDHVLIDQIVEPGKGEHQVRYRLHSAIPDPAIKPVAHAGPCSIQAKQRRGIKRVDVESVGQNGENVGVQTSDGIRSVGA